ncbi:ATP synthase F1 subunit gamma [Candidatus Gottesmanbacteria bacterium]|nr:ATP synthase F1 subunit gamma [Candidatus Gottesmanbacteria bacterium]
MASARLIKRRIRSAQNIAKITRAMEMVAASKMKKAQQLAVLGKPYAQRIYSATRELAARTDKNYHPLLSLGNPEGKLLIILISTNKGLCGGLNTNLFKLVYTLFDQQKNIDYISVGKKGQSYIVKTGKNLVADFSDRVPFTQCVSPLALFIIDGFIKGNYKEVNIVYTSFINPLRQEAVKKPILPLGIFEEKDNSTDDKIYEFLLEPSIDDILSNLLPHYIENQIRAAILEAEASEHSARMIAMRNATDAALDLMQELTLIFNKARQEKITYEIADMVTARMAVEI